jgi:hypothetical protein
MALQLATAPTTHLTTRFVIEAGKRHRTDSKDQVVAMSVSEWYSTLDSRHRRRGKALAAECEVGRRLLTELLKAKLIEHASSPTKW